MALHYITGGGDDNLQALSNMYGVPLREIQIANFGGTSLSHLYTWLKNNGGTRQSADPSVPTGYHWSFTPGMVIEIPGVAVSKSPPPASGDMKPAGPATDYETGYTGDSDEGTGIDLTPPKGASVAEGLFTMKGILIMGVLWWAIWGQKKKKTTRRRRKTTKRRTTRRKTTRRRRRR